MIRILTSFIIFFHVCFAQALPKNINMSDIIDQGIINDIHSNFVIDFDKISEQFSGKRALNNATALYESVRSSVVFIGTKNGNGSGSIVDKSGHIVTNFHVIEGNTDSTIRCAIFDENYYSQYDIPKNKLLKVKIIGVNPEKDLALLKIVKKIPNLKPISFGKSYSIKIAQDVFAIGHPSGYLWYYTNGTVNRIAPYKWYYGDNYSVSANTVFTQTPINPGNSGGPLLDGKGKMIGVNSATDPNMENVNISIRIDDVERFIDNAKKGNLSIKTTILESDQWEAVNFDEWKEIDYDKNGTTDAYLQEYELDNENNGVLIGIDKNEDGIIEFIVCDTNSDDKVDIIMYDKKGDGKFSFWEIDENFDGEFEKTEQL